MKPKKIDRIRRAHAQRHTTTGHGTSQNSDKSNNNKSTPCLYYNKGSFSQKQSHKTEGVFTNMCVLIVGTKIARPSRTLRSSAERMSKGGQPIGRVGPEE